MLVTNTKLNTAISLFITSRKHNIERSYHNCNDGPTDRDRDPTIAASAEIRFAVGIEQGLRLVLLILSLRPPAAATRLGQSVSPPGMCSSYVPHRAIVAEGPVADAVLEGAESLPGLGASHAFGHGVPAKESGVFHNPIDNS